MKGECRQILWIVDSNAVAGMQRTGPAHRRNREVSIAGRVNRLERDAQFTGARSVQAGKQRHRGYYQKAGQRSNPRS